MKFLGVIMVTMFAFQANALVADKFYCKIDYKSSDGKTKYSSEQEGYSTRLSLSSSPHPDVRLTAGEFSGGVTLPLNKESVRFRLLYKHGVMINQASEVLKAAQHTCISLDICYEEPHQPGPIVVGGCTTSMCLQQSSDPFDPQYPWSPVELYPGGTPKFDPRGLTFTTTTLPSGTVTIKCDHKYTTHDE
jgi:hypothetical protein